MDGGQELVEISQVVLAELTRGITHRLEHRRQGRCLCRQPEFGTGLPDRSHARTNRKLAGDEGSATRRAARLRIVIGEQHAFLGELVEIRCPPGHHSPVVRANIPDADVVSHNDDYVGLTRIRALCKRDLSKQNHDAGTEKQGR
jgi:hypothetical protein